MNRWVMRSYAVKRLLMWRYMHRFHRSYYVTAFPKSGGTWVGQMLAGCVDLPFPRNNTVPKWGESVVHGHYLAKASHRNVLVVLRDGRDCMVSLYHQFLYDNEWNVPAALKKIRSDLSFNDVDDIYENMPLFLEYLHTQYLKEGYMRISWAQFVDSWLGTDFPKVRYENLLDNAQGEMLAALHGLGVNVPPKKVEQVINQFSFSKVSGRQQGEEQKNSFVRKGIAGDWQNYFSNEAKDVFKHYAGKQLIISGYEGGDQW